jgi:hypothetical protein
MTERLPELLDCRALRPTTVYIARSASGIALYVGITGTRIRRLHAHAKAAEWWHKAASIELVHCDTRAEAEVLEASLIGELAARFNIQHGACSPENEISVPPELLDLAGLVAWGFPKGAARIIFRQLPQKQRGRRRYIRRADLKRYIDLHTRPAGAR